MVVLIRELPTYPEGDHTRAQFKVGDDTYTIVSSHKDTMHLSYHDACIDEVSDDMNMLCQFQLKD